MSTIKNHELEANVNYAKVHTPGNKYKSTDREYSIDAILTEDEANELTRIFTENNVTLKAFGNPRIKPLEDGTYRFKFKRNEFNSQGTPASLDVKVADSNGALVDLPTEILVGNGSRCNIHFITIPMDDGTSIVQLTGVQVMKLVPYVGGGSMKAASGGQSLEEMKAATAIEKASAAETSKAPAKQGQVSDGNPF